MQLKQILKYTKSCKTLKIKWSRSHISHTIHLSSLIQNHVLNNYEKIIGDSLKIENIRKLYVKYKNLISRDLSPHKEIAMDQWSYRFYDMENAPVKTLTENPKNDILNNRIYPSISVYPDDNNKYEVVGSDVLNEINLILKKIKT